MNPSQILIQTHNSYELRLIRLRIIKNRAKLYTVYVPSLPVCISEGDNIEDALNNIKEAIELYLESETMVKYYN